MRSQTILGIDISNSQISLTLLSQTSKSIELLKSVTAPVPEGAIADGNIKNPTLLAKTIKDTCSRNKISARRAVISLFAKPMILRVMELPKDLSANPTQHIHDELKHCAVMAGKTIIHDFCPLTPQKKTKIARLLLAAADEEKLTDLVKALNRVSINVKAVEPGVLAYMRLLHAGHIAKKFDSNILIAVVQAATTTLCVFNDANLDFMHTVEIGEQNLDTEQDIESLLAEIHAVKQYYDVETADAAKKWEIVLAFSCENDKHDNLLHSIQSNFTNATVLISSPSTLKHNSTLIVKDQTAGISPISAGLALKYLKTGEADMKINLLPAGADEVHNMQKFALMAVSIVITVFLLSLLAVPAMKMQMAGINESIKKYHEAKLSENITKLLHDGVAIEQQSKTLTEKTQAIRSINSCSAPRDWPRILQDIGSRTPQGLRITNLTSKDDTKMFLQGQAMSFDQVNLFVNLLGKSPFFSSAKLVKSEIDPLTHGLLLYNIACSFAGDKGGAHAD